MAVYLLHFERPLLQSNGRKVQHYLGYAKDLENRIGEHRRGTSRAKLPTAMFRSGISFEIARTWDGDPRRERQLKNQGSGRRKCPICNPGMRLRPKPYRRHPPPVPV